MGDFTELNNGEKIPTIGLGTYLPMEGFEEAFRDGLKTGYRHIDTSYTHMNEDLIGDELEKWLTTGKIKRQELFITTKLSSIGMRPGRVQYFLKKSLEALKLDYVDLYLIQFPVALQYVNDFDRRPTDQYGNYLLDTTTNLEAIWKAMEEQVDAGLAKSIGISNFNISQVERMLKVARIPPAVLQIELHVHNQQPEMQKLCKKHNIKLSAFAPLGAPYLKEDGPLKDPFVNKLACKLEKSPAQILLRFLIQLGVLAVPRSWNAGRLRENIDVFNFSLSPEDMNELIKLDRGVEGRSHRTWEGIYEHPEFPYPELIPKKT